MADKYIKKLADVLCGLIFDKRERDPEAYDTKATVRRIEDGKAYVHIPGGVDETPVDLTIDAKAGDTVQVRVSGGRAWLVGNRTAPPTDDTEAIVAKAVARLADQNASTAKTAAEEAEATANAVSGIATAAQADAQQAKQIATDTEQHFWFAETGTDTGAHITEVTQEKFTDPTDPDYQSGGNLLANMNGIAVREGMKELATMSQSGFESKTYDSSDNEVVIAHLGYGAGTDSGGGTSKAPYYDLGTRASGSTKGNYSVIEGRGTQATGYASHAEGVATKATSSHTHAEGYDTTASANTAHAEGYSTIASGRHSHAEGFGNTASGNYGSHAEGESTTASGYTSHAEGSYTTARGADSHAGGTATIAGYSNQTAIGKYNDNKSANLFEVGNGTGENARSNAFEVTKTGDITAPGKATLGAINGDSLFDYSHVSLTTSSIAAGASGEVTSSSITKANYYPIAIASVSIATGNASLRRFYFDSRSAGSCVIKIGVQNEGSSARTISVNADILWVKIAV